MALQLRSSARRLCEAHAARVVWTIVTVALSLSWTHLASAQRAGGFDPAARQERAQALTQQGTLSVAHGDPGSAVWFLREALQIDPSHAPAAIALGEIYMQRGQASTAREVVIATLERAPGHAALWLLLSRTEVVLGNLQNAVDALREGLRFAPRDVALLQALAEASLQRGEWLRALTVRRALHEAMAATTSPAANAVPGGGAADDAATAAIDDALRVIVGTSDRARGIRCHSEVRAVRRALAGCDATVDQPTP